MPGCALWGPIGGQGETHRFPRGGIMMSHHDAVRVIFDLEPDAVERLDRLARRDGTSRAAQLRMAVAGHLYRADRTGMRIAFGAWEGAEDGLAWTERMRTELDAR
jgi:hypothetical protein